MSVLGDKEGERSRRIQGFVFIGVLALLANFCAAFVVKVLTDAHCFGDVM